MLSVFFVDQDVSLIGDDGEAYDYKFVKWMIKEKVNSTRSFEFTQYN